MVSQVKEMLARFSDAARFLLMDLITIPSLPGNETIAQDLFFNALTKIDGPIDILRIPVDKEVEADKDYGKPYGSSILHHSPNVVVQWTGIGPHESPSLILQSHMDVVPAGRWSDAFSPRFDGHNVWGRGACDAKGQLVTLWLVLNTLAHLRTPLKGNLMIKSVVEEEIGGNGTLDLIKKGYHADAAIVLEPTERGVYPSHRGCITFQYTLTGEPVHMGRQDAGISAVEQAIELIDLLDAYKQDLLKLACVHPLYMNTVNPVQLNIGVIHAGNWPGTLAESATVAGDLGFPPNITIDQVKQDLQTRIFDRASPKLKNRYDVSFIGLHNDAYETSPTHPFIQTIVNAPAGIRVETPARGLNVSCDARLYAKRLHIPTAIFGAGSLAVAHSDKEHIQWDEILQAAEALVHIVLQWCNGSSR
jgi:acetylornithine deacetylase